MTCNLYIIQICAQCYNPINTGNNNKLIDLLWEISVLIYIHVVIIIPHATPSHDMGPQLDLKLTV